MRVIIPFLILFCFGCAAKVKAPTMAGSAPVDPGSEVTPTPTPTPQPADCVLTTSCSVTLAWDPNSEPDLAGYKIYWGSAPGTYGANVDVGNVNTYRVEGLGEGPWFFVATAYDNVGNESGYSNEVQWVPVGWTIKGLRPAPFLPEVLDDRSSGSTVVRQ